MDVGLPRRWATDLLPPFRLSARIFPSLWIISQSIQRRWQIHFFLSAPSFLPIMVYFKVAVERLLLLMTWSSHFSLLNCGWEFLLSSCSISFLMLGIFAVILLLVSNIRRCEEHLFWYENASAEMVSVYIG